MINFRCDLWNIHVSDGGEKHTHLVGTKCGITNLVNVPELRAHSAFATHTPQLVCVCVAAQFFVDLIGLSDCAFMRKFN